jgi:RND family efflux transporter MFP subunit
MALVLCMTLGCGRSSDQKGPPEEPNVDVSRPIIQQVTDYEEFTGRTDAVRSVELKALVTGYLKEMRFKEGDVVKKEDVLFTIDDRVYKAELNKTLADVKRNEAQITNSEAKLRQLSAQLARARRMATTGTAISREEVDKIVADQVEASAAVASSRAALDQSRAAADSARLNVEFTIIKAPFDGRMSRTLIDPGNLVKEKETSLSTIVSLDEVYVYFDVDERSMLRFRRLLQRGKIVSAREQTVYVEMALADEDGFPHQGTINFVDNRLDPTSGTLRVRALFKDPKRFLSPGMFARVRVPIGKAHPAVLVPEKALGTDQGEKFLYLVDDEDKVVRRNVKIGRLHGRWRVVEEGLTEKEVKAAQARGKPLRILVSGLQRVRQGSHVVVRQASEDQPSRQPDKVLPVTTTTK